MRLRLKFENSCVYIWIVWVCLTISIGTASLSELVFAFKNYLLSLIKQLESKWHSEWQNKSHWKRTLKAHIKRNRSNAFVFISNQLAEQKASRLTISKTPLSKELFFPFTFTLTLLLHLLLSPVSMFIHFCTLTERKVIGSAPL